MYAKHARLVVVFAMITIVLLVALSSTESAPESSGKDQPLIITAEPWGPSTGEVDAALARIENSPTVQSLLKGTKYRLLEWEYIDDAPKSGVTQPPRRLRTIFYDYSHDRTVVAEGDIAANGATKARVENRETVPNDDEFNEALEILGSDAKLGADVRSGELKTFRPMPPTTLRGNSERLVNVGFRGGQQNGIVGVSIKKREVVRYDGNAPPHSKSNLGSCGPASSGQATTSRGTAGQATLTVQAPDTSILWQMLIVRPAVSSGTRASGIEIRDVRYRGKSVLKRGHVPVLNVQYNPSTCGPYRDWQYQEDMFSAPDAGANDIAPGIRLLATGQVATTALETGNDTGNYRGVAIYTQNTQYGPEVVLVTELQAGWYRYIMEWRFASDGTIRPRYGFGATNNSCVCDVHNHHAYWRFDFDVVQPNNNIFQIERGRKFLAPVATEMKQTRNVATNRGFVVQNSAGDEAYEIIPGRLDGPADAFSVSDFWILRYKEVVGGTALQNEIDDGFNQTTSANAFIQIDPFVNSESVVNQDLVVWYGGNFIHSDGANLLDPNMSPEVLSGSHVVGPDLRPIRW